MALDQGVSHMQPQPGSLAYGPCGEKGVKDAGQNFRGNSRPCILDAYADLVFFFTGLNIRSYAVDIFTGSI